MEGKFPSVITLGYAVLFMTMWLFFMPAAGWFGFDSAQAALPFVIVLGGVVLAIAGVFSFFNESKTDPVVFLVLAAVNFSFAIRFVVMPNLSANTSYAPYDGWIFFLAAVVIFFVWLASLKGSSLKQFFLLGVWLAFLAGAIANWWSLEAFANIGGYVGLASALLAGWYSASTLITSKGSPSEHA
jgi:succinate-acetate transporter protein